MNWKPWKTRCHEIVLLLDILEGHTQLSRSTTCLVQVENVSCDTFLKASDASACATKDSWHLESCWRALNDYCSIWSSRSSLPAHTANAEKPRIFEVRSGSLWNKFERLCFAAICYLYVAVLTNWYKRTCVLGSVPNPATTWNWELHCYFKIRFLCLLWLWSLLHLVNLLHKDRRDTRTTRISLLICTWRLCCCFFSCPLLKVKYLSDTREAVVRGNRWQNQPCSNVQLCGTCKTASHWKELCYRIKTYTHAWRPNNRRNVRIPSFSFQLMQDAETSQISYRISPQSRV